MKFFQQREKYGFLFCFIIWPFICVNEFRLLLIPIRNEIIYFNFAEYSPVYLIIIFYFGSVEQFTPMPFYVLMRTANTLVLRCSY